MGNKEIAGEQVEKLLEDIAYLRDEAEALRAVIDSVPSNRRPSGKPSIADKLALIDHVQRSYYGSSLQKAVKKESSPEVREREEVDASFSQQEEQTDDVRNILESLVNYRVELVEMLQDLSLHEWSKVLRRGEQEVSLHRFMREMVRFERDALREISERVMMYNREKQTRRELRQRRERQEHLTDSPERAGESGRGEQE